MPPPPPPARRGTKRAGSGRGAGAGTPRAPCWRGRRGPGGGDEQRNSRTPRPQPAAPRPHRARPAGGAEGRRPRTMRPGPEGCAHLGPRAVRPTRSILSPAPGPTRVSPAGRRGRPRGSRGSLVLPAGPARARRRLPTPPPPGRHGARALRPPNCDGRAAPAPGAAGRTAQARVGGGASRRGRGLALLTWRVGRAPVAARCALGSREPRADLVSLRNEAGSGRRTASRGRAGARAPAFALAQEDGFQELSCLFVLGRYIRCLAAWLAAEKRGAGSRDRALRRCALDPAEQQLRAACRTRAL